MDIGPNGRVALITGGNRGIGLEIARQLGLRGYHTVLAARSEAKGERSARDLRKLGHSSSAVALDVADHASIERAVSDTVGAFGRVDVLINNAGIALDGGDHRPSDPDFDRILTTLNTNLLGAWACARSVLPHMRAAKYGRIVNVSSNMASLALTSDAESPAYRISKAALNMLTVVLAAEVREEGILVNAASPGYTRTDMSPKATRPVEAGADTPTWLATLPPDGPTGGFFYERSPLPW
ncbi:SDR family oxidoreductase [Sinomonas gamaensis]|uniref:SDR family oxidoreductase n=1 Tax=Sinomonas gamaensis TaxID=2565624 RepID=UPI001BB1D7B2|nr:SDR family oxidoreductase [Sinomonas gamaensis]